MQYVHTHNRTHTATRTHTHTHTQYIISTLNYVLFLCMVQEGGFCNYKINFIQLTVSLFQGSHNLKKYKDLLMFWGLRWWRISQHRQTIPVKRVLLQAGLRRKPPVEAKKLYETYKDLLMLWRLRWCDISPNRKTTSKSSGCFFKPVFGEWALMIQIRFRKYTGISCVFLLKKSNIEQ